MTPPEPRPPATRGADVLVTDGKSRAAISLAGTGTARPDLGANRVVVIGAAGGNGPRALTRDGTWLG